MLFLSLRIIDQGATIRASLGSIAFISVPVGVVYYVFYHRLDVFIYNSIFSLAARTLAV